MRPAAANALHGEHAFGRRGEGVATVGRLEAMPGAINVIPGEVQFTVDVRAPEDAAREAAVAAVRAEVERIGERRGIGFAIETLQALGSSACAPCVASRPVAAPASSSRPSSRSRRGIRPRTTSASSSAGSASASPGSAPRI